MSNYIVYSLIDPNTNEIRYIGKTIQGLKRIKEHTKDSSLKHDGNTKKANWIRKLKKNGQEPKFGILYTMGECSWSKEEINNHLYKKEQELIEFYKMLEYDLTNHQDGGPGSPNRKINEKTSRKMSESAKRRGLPKALVEQQKPKFNDPEGKRICSNCLNVKNYNEFTSGRNSRKCKHCFNENRQTRVIPGAKEKHVKSISFKVKAINVVTSDIKIFDSMRFAARQIGGNCNKTGIRNSIKLNTPYYGYIWSLI